MRYDRSVGEPEPVEAETARARPTRRVEFPRIWAALGLSVALVIAGALCGDTDEPLWQLFICWLVLGLATRFLEQPTQPMLLRALCVVIIASGAIGAAEIVGDPGFFASLLIYSGLVTAVLYVPFDGPRESQGPVRESSNPTPADRGPGGGPPLP